jgi:hypothetical protein
MSWFWFLDHADAELTTANIQNGVVRFATLLLYLTDDDMVGGETVLPLADGGMAARGCQNCDFDARAADRAPDCYRCAQQTQAEVLDDCPAALDAVVVVPRAGRLVFWCKHPRARSVLAAIV